MASKTTIAGATTGNYTNLGGAQSGTISTVVLDVYSEEIMFKAQPVLRFESVATKKTDLSASPGGRIAFILFSNLKGPSAITETSTIETDVLESSMRYITVGEHARAIGFSELLFIQSVTDVLSDASQVLGMNYARTRDMNIRDSLYTGAVTKYGDGVQLNRADLQNATQDKMQMETIRNAVEVLAVNKAPKFGGDAYICIVHPHQAIALRRESGWLNAIQYGDPTRLYNGEIGRIEDVRFIETTMVQMIVSVTSGNSPVWTDNEQEVDRAGAGITTATNVVGTGGINNVYRAVICGENCVGIADALPVEMRDNGVEDFGRKHSLAYYAIYGAGLIETGHSLILETN